MAVYPALFSSNGTNPKSVQLIIEIVIQLVYSSLFFFEFDETHLNLETSWVETEYTSDKMHVAPYEKKWPSHVKNADVSKLT